MWYPPTGDKTVSVMAVNAEGTAIDAYTITIYPAAVYLPFVVKTRPIDSGMVMQVDTIPSSPVHFSIRMEDGVVIADESLRRQIKEQFPDSQWSNNLWPITLCTRLIVDRNRTP